jgi:hypothetical protein
VKVNSESRIVSWQFPSCGNKKRRNIALYASLLNIMPLIDGIFHGNSYFFTR